MVTRRDFIHGSALALGAAALAKQVEAQSSPRPSETATAAGPPSPDTSPGAESSLITPGSDASRVITPNGASLPFRLINGVKVFHLIAEPIAAHEIAPGLVIHAWGYNGRTPGPTIEAVEGDRVRIYVTNRLPEGTTVHWHGVRLPNGMDGVAGLTQPKIEPGETYRYEFTLKNRGTFMYHPHFDEMTQMALGMMGMFVVQPRGAKLADKEFCLMLNEWKIPAGASRPDPNAMSDFNVLTFNGKVFPATAPLVVQKGDRVRLRIGNLSPMDHHPIHLHGFASRIVATDGGEIPPSAQWPETSALVPVGTTRDFAFVADAEGDWPLHCHMTHHIMTQMGHDTPNMIGVNTDGVEERLRRAVPGYMSMGQNGMGDHGEHAAHMGVPRNSTPMRGGPGPFGTIDMGGMFTLVKVRPRTVGQTDPGPYIPPDATRARVASNDELLADGIEL